MQIGTNQKPSRQKEPDMVLRLSESTSTPLSHPCCKFGRPGTVAKINLPSNAQEENWMRVKKHRSTSWFSFGTARRKEFISQPP